MYILLALSFVLVIIIATMLVMMLRNNRKRKPQAQENSIDRRQAYRLYINNKMCNVQPLYSSSREAALICDISTTGIRIETKSDSLTLKSLLLIYFTLEEETFLLEGMVKRKQTVAINRDQYGIKFIFINPAMEENLQKKLTSLTRKIAQ
ncbi:PilZ domain-containing protein [Neobacillus sp. NPDC093127]|uniref:PilZ domain-containing protein n=1 Tax=Neobacillus sp. NPDC093127 TaxID=3364296 RepID=UPI003809079C